MLSIHTKWNRSLLVMILSIVSFGVSSGTTRANEIKPQQVKSSYDIVVYGGASGGIAAALQAKRMGKTVLLIQYSNKGNKDIYIK